MGLVDTGADVNVLPYQLGVELGAQWSQQTIGLQLSGNLSNYEARGLIVQATVADLPCHSHLRGRKPKTYL
ncbi:MAG: hypothetical protein OHK0046_32850 [Anaerolineae bacterium]